MDFLDRLSAGPKAWLILFLITFTAAAPGVVSLPALDRDESRYAQASKQMLESGDLIRIRYQDEMRNQKPAGIYWLQAGSVSLFSPSDRTQIWAYRIPSWLGASLATLAAFWAGIILVGRRAAFAGAAMFGATLLLTTEAHIAKTDAVLVFVTIIAMGALAHLYLKTDYPRRMAVIVWLSMGLGFLIKGPITPMMVILTMLALIIWDRADWRWARQLLWWPGPLLFILLTLPWLVAIQIATGGAFLDEAIGKDLRDKVAGSSEGHGGPPGYHLLYLPTHFFPATILLVPAIVLAARNLRQRTLETLGAKRTESLKFLLAWIVPAWLVFELLPTKLSHYVLPVYPALALLGGWALMQATPDRRNRLPGYISLAVFSLGAFILLLISSPLGDGLLMREAASDYQTVPAERILAEWSGNARFSLWLWGAGLLAVSGTIIASLMRRAGTSVLLAILASVLIGWHIRGVFLPAQSWAQPTVAAQTALASICALPEQDPSDCQGALPERVQSVGYAEPSMVLEIGTDTTLPPRTIVGLPGEDDTYPIVYILNTEDAAGADALAALIVLSRERNLCARQSEPAYALNYSNGDPVVFVALRIDAAPCRS